MIENYPTFFLAILILTITPGLDTAMILKNTARGGYRDGMYTSLGICSGLFLHATLSVLGISAILNQSVELFLMVKMIGAGYLIWLGVSGVFSLFSRKQSVLAHQVKKSKLSVWQSMRQGFLSNILNPKTAIFYLAFLPQFIDYDKSVWLQAGIMVGTHFVLAMVWQCTLARLLASVSHVIKSPGFIRAMEGSTAAILLLLGVRLLLESR